MRLHKINEEIEAPTVRVVGNKDESINGVMPTPRALSLAVEMEVDLVEIVANQEVPIVRMIEYSKFKYELKKKERETKAKQHVTTMKEIRFGPNTDEHDFNFKLKHAQKFLQEGNKVRAYVHFHGRSIVYKDRGKKVLLEFAQNLEEIAKVEQLPKMEGKRMHIILTPRPGATKKKDVKKDAPKAEKKPKVENTEKPENLEKPVIIEEKTVDEVTTPIVEVETSVEKKENKE